VRGADEFLEVRAAEVLRQTARSEAERHHLFSRLTTHITDKNHLFGHRGSLRSSHNLNVGRRLR